MWLHNLNINGWVITFLLSGGFLFIFVMAEVMYHRLKVKAELTRKFVHLTSGILTLTFPLLLENHWQALFLCGSFALLLAVSQVFDFLKSINQVDRVTYGSFLFPVSVYICFHAWEHTHSLFHFYAPMAVLAISDPMAALFGKKWPRGKYRIYNETKTLVGSSAFLLSAYFILAIMTYLFLVEKDATSIFYISLVVALATTLSEAISQKGVDNLLIPITILALYYFM